MNAAVHPVLCISAIAWRVRVVFPLDSGQYISITLHLAYHQPKAKSRLNDQEGVVSTF
jgi:hypothetical protein